VPDTTPLQTAVEHFADALRAAPQSRLRRGAAAEGLGLARELALRAQRNELPGREPVIMPDAGMFAVADQVAVAGTDLAEALRTAPAAREDEVAEAVALVREARRRAFP
jgi:energy-converting hydrogenase Eha subunit G